VSGSGIASAVSVGAGEEGKDGNAVNVKGDSGDIGNGCTVVGMVVVEPRGFSFACRSDPNVRGLGVRVVGEPVGGGNGGLAVVVVEGGVGGVDGRAVGGVAICCDNFDGASCPLTNKQSKFPPSAYEKQIDKT
jgi:hypothetical protein